MFALPGSTLATALPVLFSVRSPSLPTPYTRIPRAQNNPHVSGCLESDMAPGNYWRWRQHPPSYTPFPLSTQHTPCRTCPHRAHSLSPSCLPTHRRGLDVSRTPCPSAVRPSSCRRASSATSPPCAPRSPARPRASFPVPSPLLLLHAGPGTRESLCSRSVSLQTWFPVAWCCARLPVCCSAMSMVAVFRRASANPPPLPQACFVVLPCGPSSSRFQPSSRCVGLPQLGYTLPSARPPIRIERNDG